MASVVTFSVVADFDQDGVYETELASYINTANGGVRVKRGMGPDGVYQVSSCEIGLNNDRGYFNPEYSASPFYGKLRRDIPIRIIATFLARTYIVWTGYASRWRAASGLPGETKASVQCDDLARLMAESEPVNLTVSTTRDADGAIAETFAYLGLTASDYILDDGQATFPLHFARGQTAMQACMDAVRSELGGRMFVTAEGKLRFESRTQRLGISSYRVLVRRDGAAAAWRFGEATGTAARDETDQGNNGVYVAAPTLAVAALIGGSDPDTAVTLNGTTQWVTVADNALLDPGDTFTLEFWLKRGGGLASTRYLCSKGAGGYGVFFNATNNLVLEKVGTGNIVASSTAIAETTTAHHVVVTKSGATAAKVYIDDVDVSGAVTDQTVVATAVQLVIGADSTPANAFNGTLDEVAIYAYALTAEQVHEHYSIGTNGRVWGDNSALVKPERVDYELTDEDYVTSVSVKTTAYEVKVSNQKVYGDPRNKKKRPTANSPSMAAGEAYEVDINLDGAVAAIVAPVAYTDYEANDNAAGSSTDRTGTQTVTITDLGAGARLKWINGHTGTVYRTKQEVRATRYDYIAQSVTARFSKTVPGAKAGRGVDLAIGWADDSITTRNYAYGLLRMGRYGYGRVELVFAWDADAIIEQCLMAELGDLVEFTDQAAGAWGTYVKDWWNVEAIAHDLRPYGPGGVRRTMVTLAPAYLYRNTAAIVWDDFDNANLTADLGTAKSGHTWATDTGFDRSSNTAVLSNDVTEQIATLALGTRDCVVEASFAGL